MRMPKLPQAPQTPQPPLDLPGRARLARVAFVLAALSLSVISLVLGCNAEPPNTPDPAPGGGTVSNNGIAGLVMAPPAMRQDGGIWDNVHAPLDEAPLAGVKVYLLGERGKALDVPPATTDDKGIFRFDSVPVEAGLVSVTPPAVEAYKPLLAYYRRKNASYVGVASTLVAGALQKAITDKPSLTYAAFNADQVDALQKKVEAKLAKPTNVISLHFLEQTLLAWAEGDKDLKAPLEALSPGITAKTNPK
jgi:hypothetical protein